MDLRDTKILEKAADILSELKFNDADLQKVYSLLVDILEKENQLLCSSFTFLGEIPGEKTAELDFKKLIEMLGANSRSDTLQRFSSHLLNNQQLLDLIQNLAIEKIRNNLLKSPTEQKPLDINQ